MQCQCVQLQLGSDPTEASLRTKCLYWVLYAGFWASGLPPPAHSSAAHPTQSNTLPRGRLQYRLEAASPYNQPARPPQTPLPIYLQGAQGTHSLGHPYLGFHHPPFYIYICVYDVLVSLPALARLS